jgi:hypothetical protein
MVLWRRASSSIGHLSCRTAWIRGGKCGACKDAECRNAGKQNGPHDPYAFVVWPHPMVGLDADRWASLVTARCQNTLKSVTTVSATGRTSEAEDALILDRESRDLHEPLIAEFMAQ